MKNSFEIILLPAKFPPRFFKIPLSFIKRFVLSLSFLLILSLCSGVVFFLQYWNLKTKNTFEKPNLISPLQQEIIDLKKELSEEKLNYESLLKKLASKEFNDIHALSLFKASPGRRDRTQEMLLEIEGVQLSHKDKTMEIKFDIKNLTPNEKKIAGHIFVVAQQNNLLQIFPNNALNSEEFQLDFDDGLRFATARFRPLSLSFDKYGENPFLLKIFIFSLDGDLLLKKIISDQ